MEFEAEINLPDQSSPKKNPEKQVVDKFKEWTIKGVNWLSHLFRKSADSPKEVLQEIIEAPKIEASLIQDNEGQAGQTETTQLKEMGQYIGKTMEKISENSEQALHNFIEGDAIIDRVQSAVRVTIQVEVAAELFPDERESILTLLPDAEDWITIPRARGNDDRSAIFSTSNKQRQRRNIIEKASGYPFKQEFEERVEKRIRERASKVVEEAKEGIQNFGGEGQVLVISMKPDDLLGMLDSGAYEPSLDRYEMGYWSFLPSEKDQIAESLQGKIDPTRRFDGIGPLARRYLREIELGTYPENGESSLEQHPVYGQMVVDSTFESRLIRLAGYGEVVVKLKKEAVINRTLFVVGDSINDAHDFNQKLAWNEAIKARKLLNNLIQDEQVDRRSLPGYIEAQIMGGVKLADIEEITLDKSEISPELQQYLDANREKMVLIENDNTVSIRPTV